MNRRSKFLFLVFVVILALGMFPATSWAAGETGTTGIWKWTVLGDGTLSITGCTTPIGDLTLPASLETGSGSVAVTRIESNAFKPSNPIFFPSAITSFTMPDSIISVGDSAFSSCSKMTSVTMSANLKSIGASAFYSCEKLTDITIPDSVESIGSNAFSYCYALVNATLPNNPGFTVIPEKFFWGDGRLKTTNIASLNHLESIGIHAFGDSGIETITLPNSVTTIGAGAFEACRSLRTITLPENAGFTAIPDSLFGECEDLESITIPQSVTSIGADVFQGCTSLTEINVAAGNSAFSSEDGVLYNAGKTILIRHPAGRAGALDIPNSVTQIGGYALVDSKQLTSVSIPEGVESIGTYAFFNCNHPSLTRIVLPESVVSIGSFAFSGCARLTNMVIPAGISDIAEYTFSGCSNLTDMTIPESVLNIGAYAFFGCERMETITIPKDVGNIGNYAFGFCMNLKKLLVPGSTTFGSNVFQYASAIKAGGANGFYGYGGSNAQTYAQANGIAFHPLYTVSFSAGEGTSVPDIVAAAGEGIVKPANPSHPSQYFAGWYKDADCTDDWNFDSDTVSGDTVLYAKWSTEPVYTVPEITTISLPDGMLGTPYSQTLAAHYGAPILWSIYSGTLPEGLTLDPATGAISGTPAATGTSSFTVMAVNSQGDDTQALSIAITDVPPPDDDEPYSPPPVNPYVQERYIVDKGDEITIDLTQGSSTLSASQIDTLISLNQDEPVVLDGDGYTITFPPGSLGSSDAGGDCDLGIQFNTGGNYAAIQSLTGNDFVLMLEFNHSGPLPGEARIRIYVGTQYAGQTLLYQYFNPSTGNLEFLQDANVDADGYVVIHQSRCSEYVLSVGGAALGIPKTGNDTSSLGWLLLCGVLAAGITMLTVPGKRRGPYKR